jgi:short-subunit dehydrogenase
MPKTTLITGASAGLGEEMARQFAALGHDLALCARRTDRLDALKNELSRRHPAQRFEVRALDVDDHDQVFAVFRAFRADFGGVDRVVVNAGVGAGAPLGTGQFDTNRKTATTNFVSALAQTEAAMEIFRAQGRGHLVMISSIGAMRGMPRAAATYAATKAGVAHLAEGVRAELVGTPIKVSVIYPGFIRSEILEDGKNPPFVVPTVKGVRAMVEAIEKQRPRARVPAWPWVPIGFALKHLPLGVAKRLMSGLAP